MLIPVVIFVACLVAGMAGGAPVASRPGGGTSGRPSVLYGSPAGSQRTL
jgi:hypothetical protein